jgi:hypothetical protein
MYWFNILNVQINNYEKDNQSGKMWTGLKHPIKAPYYNINENKK